MCVNDPKSLIFHFTHDAGKPSPSSSKEIHISLVCCEKDIVVGYTDLLCRRKRFLINSPAGEL